MRHTMIHAIAIVMTVGILSGGSAPAVADDNTVRSGGTSLTPAELRFRKSQKATSLRVQRRHLQGNAPAEPVAGPRDEAEDQSDAAGRGGAGQSTYQELPTTAD